MHREVITMKHLLAIFLIGVSCFLFGCEQYEAAKHYNRGLAYDRQGKLDEAVVEYKKAIAINPDYAEA
ncbi:MAG: tetratricopeptide repeat protein, partial [Deltaproteobacteria bacterium]|nr:tetratricopeptide repeat protein [Deltaproteobacteria bacterium]